MSILKKVTIITIIDIISKRIHINANKYAPKPDLTILFDVDEDVAIERCDETEVFEKLDFLRKTRKNYLRLLEENSEMIKIDSTGSIDDVKYEVLKLLSDKLDL